MPVRIAHQLVALDPKAGDLSSPAFPAISPRGQAPALCLPVGKVVTEIPAILTHLADANPDGGLAPLAGTSAGAQRDRWLAFMQAEMRHPARKDGR